MSAGDSSVDLASDAGGGMNGSTTDGEQRHAQVESTAGSVDGQLCTDHRGAFDKTSEQPSNRQACIPLIGKSSGALIPCNVGKRLTAHDEALRRWAAAEATDTEHSYYGMRPLENDALGGAIAIVTMFICFS
jgi:hypothetical protein